MKAAADEAAAQRSNTWLTKTLSTIRDATSNASSHSSHSSSSGKSVKTSNSISGGISVQGDGGNGHEVGTMNSLPQQQQQSQHQQPSRRFSSRDIYHPPNH